MAENKIVLKAKAQLLEVSDIGQEVFSTIAKFSGDESVNQEDLLHIRSVLVTTGANENKDVFTKGELWAARNTPLHKPSDWDHDRTRIIGHMYRVEARTLDGRELDLSANEPTLVGGESYDGDFELAVDEVIYAYLLPEYAEAIREKAAAGNLFVSMEVWFHDYDYAVWKSDDEQSVAALDDNIEIIARGEDKSMEQFLRTAGGSGKLEDGRHIGRALKQMVFGGKGFVSVPANPRSVIEKISKESAGEDLENEEDTFDLDVGNLQSVTAIKEEEVGQGSPQILMEETMSKENVDLEARIQELEGHIKTLEQENADLKASAASEALEKADAARMKSFDDVLRAMASSAEIARIDALLDGDVGADELFSAKLALFSEIAGAMKARAEDAEKKVLEHRTAERFEKVKALDLYSETRLEKVKEQIGTMNDEDFGDWFEEKQELAGRLNELKEKLVASEETEDVKEEVEETKSEGSEAEAALEALSSAESEDEPDIEGTEAEKEDKVDEGFRTFIELTTKRPERKRGK